MTRIAAITPAHREHLRQLRADFDRAYDAIEDVYDRSSPRFRDAETLYRVWIKAINSMAMALLDDLDALDIGGGGPRPAASVRSPYSPINPTLPFEDNSFNLVTAVSVLSDIHST